MDIIPAQIMENILWAFRGKPFDSQREFEEAVRDYHLRIANSDKGWRPKELGLARAKVKIQYTCWHKNEEVEPVVLLESNDGASFTQGELLYKIHNAVVADLKDMDHCFFEGLSLNKKTARDEAPLYFISLGS